MERWEYCRVFVKWSSTKNDLVTCVDGRITTITADNPDPTLIETANDLGGDGWELVGLHVPGDMGSLVMAMFKRPVRPSV